MRLTPLKQWQCDTCKTIIKCPEEGFLEFQKNKDHKYYGFRIVHREDMSPGRNCSRPIDGSSPGSIPLNVFSETEPLNEFLKFLDIGPFHDSTYSGPLIKDIREFVEIFRRILMPHYEEARMYWPHALAEGLFGGVDSDQIYSQENLLAIIERFRDE